MCDFDVGGIYAIKQFFFFLQKFSTSHKEQTSPCRILVLFLDMRRCKNGAHEIFS